MFKYTKASLNILIDDVKRYSKIFKWCSFGFTLAFTAYQVITGILSKNGLVIINIAMAALIILSTVLDVIFEKNELKRAKKISKRTFKWIKIAIKAFSLGVTILDIYKSGAETTGISIILATLMILLWIVSFVAEIAVEIISDRAEELMIAWKEDVEDIKRPFTAVSNTFKKITGRGVSEEPIDPKKEKIISKLKDRIEKDKIEDDDEE